MYGRGDRLTAQNGDFRPGQKRVAGLAVGTPVPVKQLVAARRVTKGADGGAWLLVALDTEAMKLTSLDGARQGSAGRGVKGVFDPFGGLTRPPSGIVMQRFLRESLYNLCVDPPHTRPLPSPGVRAVRDGSYTVEFSAGSGASTGAVLPLGLARYASECGQR